jgi:hypothetical protein
MAVTGGRFASLLRVITLAATETSTIEPAQCWGTGGDPAIGRRSETRTRIDAETPRVLASTSDVRKKNADTCPLQNVNRARTTHHCKQNKRESGSNHVGGAEARDGAEGATPG